MVVCARVCYMLCAIWVLSWGRCDAATHTKWNEIEPDGCAHLRFCVIFCAHITFGIYILHINIVMYKAFICVEHPISVKGVMSAYQKYHHICIYSVVHALHIISLSVVFWTRTVNLVYCTLCSSGRVDGKHIMYSSLKVWKLVWFRHKW